MKRGIIITIDGPAGAGKSTVARLLARKLDYQYLDTGALYRVVTYQALRKKVRPTDQQILKKMIKALRIRFTEGDNQQRVFLNGREVTAVIRNPAITDNVFRYAELPLVRREMVKIQRALGARGNIVTEGRDLGSVVFPRAEIKFYLDASVAERARRRYQELCRKRIAVGYADIRKEIKTRDQRDMTRKLAPLKAVREAIQIDTTHLSIAQVVRKLYRVVRRLSDVV